MKQWLFLLGLLLLGGMILNAQTGEVTPEATETAPEITPEATILVVEPLMGLSYEIPLSITLPEGWELVFRDTYIYRDVVEDADGLLETVPLDVYRGPLTNADGWIVVVWGYDSLIPSSLNNTGGDFTTRALWLDGLRMLQLVVFNAGCNIGTAPQRDYTIGNLPATGTTFSAVDCPNEVPDTRGWFAAMTVDNINFAFYVYADPIQPAGSIVEFELQAILDTVDFRVDEYTISQEEFQATQQAIIQQTLNPVPTIAPTVSPEASQAAD